MTTPPPPSDALRYRLAEPSDVPRLLQLWTEHSGWGAITMAQWRSWYDEAPYGPALVSVAEDADGHLLGMLVALPCLASVHGEVVPAIRPSAPILHASARAGDARPGQSPALALYLASAAAAAARGHAVVCVLPDARWVPFIRRAARTLPGLPRHATTVGSLALDVSTFAGQAPAGLSAAPSTRFDDELGHLWDEAVRRYPIRCALSRTPAWLSYKHRGDVRIEVRGAAGGLAGLVTVSPRRHAISNVVTASPDDLADVLLSAMAWLREARRDGHAGVPSTLAALDHGPCGRALRSIGFTEFPYRFGFLADTLDEARVPLDVIEPGAWYLTAGD